MRKVAIEKNLTNIEDYLRNAGYEVKEFDDNLKNNPSWLNSFDAIVLNDLSKNVMGYEDAITSTTTIDAVGMTPEQVKETIEKTAQKR